MLISLMVLQLSCSNGACSIHPGQKAAAYVPPALRGRPKPPAVS